MEFKGKILDEFQIQAIQSIDKGNSCIVSASTGTGKTLIAEYVISKHLPEGNIIIYTAPIKALSNQKFKDFCEDYGKDKVGLLTGDHTINGRAPILIMTTEIYRNMLLTNEPLLDKVSYVIFDEIHYINDIQRGTVWEESLIFSPPHIRFLALSATIPNYKEFATWIEKIKEHKVDTVFYGHRPVPLKHHVFDKKLGLTTIEEVQHDLLKEDEFLRSLDMMHPRKKKQNHKRRQNHAMKPPYHLEVIPCIENKLPTLYFCFSRKKCEDFAVELASKKDYLSVEENREVTNYVRSQITEEIAKMDSTRTMRRTLPKGVAYHHSGLLPALKQIVEHLFAKGLVKVLYTTETFSVGINMPAKAVVFNSTEKYDGITTRMLNAKEYFQIAGRAGRRGIDTEGTVIALINRQFTNLKKLDKISTVDDEPIKSQFTLSINTALNLIQLYDDETQKKVLKSSFDYYVKSKNGKKINIMASFKHKIKLLEKLRYIKKAKEFDGGAYIDKTHTYELTKKGQFARNLYSNEINLTELFHLSCVDDMSNIDLLITLAAIVYEERRRDYFMIKGCDKTYARVMKRLNGTKVELNKISLKRMINFVTSWATGGKFSELMELSNLQEGDIIRFFRRLIDTLTQLQRATDDEVQKERMQKLINLIDRDLVSADI